MWYQVDDDNRICGIRYTDPPEIDLDIWSWIDADIPEDFQDYLVIDGKLVDDPLPIPIQPVMPSEVIKAIFTASPGLTVGIPNALAVRMVPYLPDYDPKTTYTIGMLVVDGDVVRRKVIGGWKDLG